MDSSISTKFPKVSLIEISRSKKDLLAILLFSLPIAAMVLFSRLDFRLISDEATYHIKIIESFASNWPNVDVVNYQSASTPLSYILMTAFGKLVGLTISNLRLLSSIATLIAVYFFYRLSKLCGLRHPILSSLLLLFFPYVFFFGFTIYPAAIALFFGLWGLSYLLIDRTTPNTLLKGSILMSLAVLCRQSFIVIPLGIAIHELWQWRRNSFDEPANQLLLRIAILGIPILLFIPFVVVWGGYTSPLNRAGDGGVWFLQFNPQHLNYILMLVGFYFLPLVLTVNIPGLIRHRRNLFLSTMALLSIFIMFPVIYSGEADTAFYARGLLIHGIEVLRVSLGSSIATLAKAGLWMAGLIILMNRWTMRTWSSQDGKLVAIGLTFILFLMFSPFVLERYYMLLIPILILILHKRFEAKRALIAWVGVQAVLVTGYSYWQIVLK